VSRAAFAIQPQGPNRSVKWWPMRWLPDLPRRRMGQWLRARPRRLGQWQKPMRHAWARMHNGPPGRRRLPDIILERCRITAHLLVLVRCPWRGEQRLQGWHPRVPAEQALEHNHVG